MDHSVLMDIVILLLAAVLSVSLFRRLQLPPVLAYLFVGILVGPYAFAWIPNTDNTRFLAEFGVVFLMFTVGLEFSFAQLLALRKEVFGFGGAQVFITTVVTMIFLTAIGQPFAAAFIVGGVVALSSTAIVIKQLNEQLELQSRHGRLSVAILIFQDLAVVPFLIIIPALSINTEGSLIVALIMAVIKGFIVIGFMLAFGQWLLRPLFYEIARQHSSELFTLTILLFSVAAAWVTDIAGLSLALGAFVAGMMLAETEFKHQVEVDIRPFKDVLMGLFFITIGMLLDLKMFTLYLPEILASVVGIILLKFIVVMFIGHLSKLEKGVTSRTALSLAQGGEFGFALLAIAFSNGLLDEKLSQVVLASVILTMVVSPIIIKYNGFFAKHFFTNSYMQTRKDNVNLIEEETRTLKDHVIICGYGRIGQNIARFLKDENFEYVAIDLDPITVKNAHESGEHVFYGDTTHRDILVAVNILNARVLVISYDDFHAATRIIQQTRMLRPDIPILVRTRDDSHLTELQNIGATEVVPETLEASLMLSSHLLMLMGVPMKRVLKTIKTVRESRYQLLHEFFHGQDAVDVADADTNRIGLHSFSVPGSAFCVGKPIGFFEWQKIDVKITALRQKGICLQKPSDEIIIEESDVLVLYATPESFEKAQTLLLTG